MTTNQIRTIAESSNLIGRRSTLSALTSQILPKTEKFYQDCKTHPETYARKIVGGAANDFNVSADAASAVALLQTGQTVKNQNTTSKIVTKYFHEEKLI